MAIVRAIIEQLGPICPQGADWAQLQEALFPRAYNLHMAFCEGLQNRKGLIAPASHHGIHPAVCRVYGKENLFYTQKRIFGYGRIFLDMDVSFWIWPLVVLGARRNRREIFTSKILPDTNRREIFGPSEMMQ